MRSFRVLFASPGDVARERQEMDSVVDGLNKGEGRQTGFELELLKWKTHSAPSAGRPQAVISDDFGEYDVFVGVMWKRIGTPSGAAISGTVEEFDNAYRAWQEDATRPVLFYFCQCPFMPETIEEAKQMCMVLEFRHRIESKRQALVWDYPGYEDFPGMIRKHLALRVGRLCEAPRQGKIADPEEASVLRDLWDRMEPEVQRAFSVAYNENRLAGDGGIKTKDLFAALLRVAPDTLRPLTSAIPAEALPSPTDGPLFDADYIARELPWLSHCVASSVGRLSKDLSPGERLSAVDIFADIAHKGTGSSVAQLRNHKIGPDEIETILRRNGMELVSK